MNTDTNSQTKDSCIALAQLLGQGEQACSVAVKGLDNEALVSFWH